MVLKNGGFVKKTIAIIAAHPDDEILGCGGSIAKHSEAGDSVHLLIMTQGEASRHLIRDQEEISIKKTALKNSATQAAEILGVKTVELLDFPDNKMDSVNRLDIIKQVEGFIESYQPSRIYTHHGYDVNIDHRLVYEAVITAARPQPGHCVKEIFSFEILSSTDWQSSTSSFCFSPNYFVSLSEYHQKLKLDAMAVYKQELREWPHPRSIEGCQILMKYRGSSVGYKAAEAFEIVRVIE